MLSTTIRGGNIIHRIVEEVPRIADILKDPLLCKICEYKCVNTTLAICQFCCQGKVC